MTKDSSIIAPIVIKIGGAAVDDPRGTAGLWEAIGWLHRATGVILVHGGGAAIDRRLKRLGMESERREGIRITPPDQMEEVVAGLAGCVNTTVVGALLRHGSLAVGLTLADGRSMSGRKSDRYPFDPGQVGEVDPGDPTLIHTLIGSGFLPVLSSIALDPDGEPLNVNADDAAAGVARLVRARALVLLTDVPGVIDSGGRLIEELAPDDVERRIAAGEITGGMIVKTRSAARTADGLGVPVIIGSWKSPATLRALAEGGRAGTRFIPGRRNGGATTA